MDIVLASASPRRRVLLSAVGLEFEAISTDVPEEADGPVPRAVALKNAALKAQAAVVQFKSDQPTIYIASDTIVVLGKEILGKPKDREDAARMLQMLSGSTHEVITALAIQLSDRPVMWLDAEKTEVTFHPISADDIAIYLATGQADDKAGSYGIQDGGGAFIERVEGDLTNVIGLPLRTLRRGLSESLGEDLLPQLNPKTAVMKAFDDLDERLLDFVR